ncbi:MAG: SDR family oxidoreductase [Anaerolineales bacterium]|nr:SDR family oxidoreductase [Anaerolineales bacterium]
MVKKLVLVTGATGYIASKLIPELLKRGHRVRCLVRQPLRLKARIWLPYVEVVQGDVMDPSTLPPAVDGVHTAYYLIHNMSSGRGYTSLERNGAQNFMHAAEQAGIGHVIYLGGLADPNRKIPYHMRSRIETGETLRKGKLPVTEFRAGVIVGPGSISFEMIRFITELMPIVFGPVWLQNMSQPIAAQNVIDYLLAALENRFAQSKVFEIGGPDRMSYAELMLTYGRLRELWRKYMILPGIPLWFMALGVERMTPVPAAIARPLVDGLRSDSLVQDESARRTFPNVNLIGYEEAVNIALGQLRPDRLEPAWRNCDRAVKFMKHEGFFIDHRCEGVDAAPEKAFHVVSALGGKNGWLYANWLWNLRGWLDRLFGGPGMRGCPNSLKVGDTLDFYRVEAIEDDQLLRLYSELKTPGEGWMEWRIETEEGGTKISQTGFFAPRGFWGFAYWILLEPFHRSVFRGLIRAIARQSEM